MTNIKKFRTTMWTVIAGAVLTMAFLCSHSRRLWKEVMQMRMNHKEQILVAAGIATVMMILLAVGCIEKEARLFAFLLLMGGLSLLCWMQSGKRFFDALFNARFFLAGSAFVLCVLFEFTGSSIGCWSQLLGQADNDILLGVSRAIRSDEWAVFTPMAWAQYYAEQPFQYFNEVIRGCPTDVFLEYGQAVFSILMIFRPFYLGYLFLPLAMGMAFFWSGRLIALFVVSFEFGLLITKRCRSLSLAYALSVVLAPAVSWWFAIGGLVEMLIYTQLSILMMRMFMRTDRLWIRITAVSVIIICAGGYVLTMYPASQVPMGFVLLALIIWTFLDNFKECRMRMRDWIVILSAIVCFVILMGLVLYYSLDTIQIIMDTAYPGKRFDAGGGGLSDLFTQYSNIWFGIKNESPYANVCENSRFIDFFPLCWFFPAAVMIKSKQKDHLLKAGLAVSLFLTIYIIFGIPAVLAKLTLMGYSTAARALLPTGFCNLVLLFRAMGLAVNFQMGKRVSALGLGILVSCLGVWVVYSQNPAYFSTKMLVTTLLVFSFLIVGSLFCSKRMIRNLWCCGMAVMLMISGGIVNPIRSGIDSIKEIPEFQALCEFEKEDSLWVVEGVGFPLGNLPIMAGLPTINSTNVYPNLERWESLDNDGKYREIYNRYAHITVFIVEDSATDQFQAGITPDQFTVNLTIDDLRTLGVTHILSPNDLSAFEGIEFMKGLDSALGLKVYRLY